MAHENIKSNKLAEELVTEAVSVAGSNVNGSLDQLAASQGILNRVLTDLEDRLAQMQQQIPSVPAQDMVETKAKLAQCKSKMAKIQRLLGQIDHRLDMLITEEV